MALAQHDRGRVRLHWPSRACRWVPGTCGRRWRLSRPSSNPRGWFEAVPIKGPALL